LHPASFGVGKTMENPMYLKPSTFPDEDNEGLINPDFDDPLDVDEKEK